MRVIVREDCMSECMKMAGVKMNADLDTENFIIIIIMIVK